MVLNGQTLIAQQVSEIQRKLGIAPVTAPTANAWTITNATPLRTINVSTATLTDALNAIAALTADLKAAGILPP